LPILVPSPVSGPGGGQALIIQTYTSGEAHPTRNAHQVEALACPIARLPLDIDIQPVLSQPCPGRPDSWGAIQCQPASYMYEDTYLPRSKRQVILKLACVWDLHQRTCLGPPCLQLAAPTRSKTATRIREHLSLLTIRTEAKERRVYWAIDPVSSDFCSAF
jgi:hypothetical protein